MLGTAKTNHLQLLVLSYIFCVVDEEATVARPLSPARGRLLGPGSDMLEKKSAKTVITISCIHNVWLSIIS